MSSFTLSRSDVFPVGTVVSVYPGGAASALGPARAAAVTSGTVGAGGAVTFSGLADDTPYVAHAAVGSGWGAIKFRVSDSVSATGRALGTCDTSSGSASLANVTPSAGVVVVGQRFTAPGVPPGSFVESVNGGTVVLSDKAKATATGVAFDAYGALKWRARLRARRAALGTS